MFGFQSSHKEHTRRCHWFHIHIYKSDCLFIVLFAISLPQECFESKGYSRIYERLSTTRVGWRKLGGGEQRFYSRFRSHSEYSTLIISLILSKNQFWNNLCHNCAISTKCAGSVREISTICYYTWYRPRDFWSKLFQSFLMNARINAIDLISNWYYYDVWLWFYKFSKFNEIRVNWGGASGGGQPE